MATEVIVQKSATVDLRLVCVSSYVMSPSMANSSCLLMNTLCRFIPFVDKNGGNVSPKARSKPRLIPSMPAKRSNDNNGIFYSVTYLRVVILLMVFFCIRIQQKHWPFAAFCRNQYGFPLFLCPSKMSVQRRPRYPNFSCCFGNRNAESDFLPCLFDGCRVRWLSTFVDAA